MFSLRQAFAITSRGRRQMGLALFLVVLAFACSEQSGFSDAGTEAPPRAAPSTRPSKPGAAGRGSGSAGTSGTSAADGGKGASPSSGAGRGSAGSRSAADGGQAGPAADGGDADASAGMPQAGSASAPPAGSDPSAEVYDSARLPRFDIELPPASVSALEAVAGSDDPQQDAWVHATLRYGSELVSDIGLRIKGEGSFRDLSRKTPFKIKFDEFVPDQQFRGLKRLTLNNMVEDPSFLAERLAYEVFRAAGLPAPRCNNALVYVNGEFYGVYANVEAEDKPFLRRWFSDDGGNLYEEGQHDFTPGGEDTFDLETNEAANDRTDLRGLIDALDGSSATTLLTDLEPHLNVTHYLRFTAAEAAVNQWDMYSYTLFWPNNFRFYADPSTGKFVFLPWGMDMAMKPYPGTGRAHIDVFGLVHQFDDPNGSVSTGVIFQRCLESPDCRSRYAATVAEITTLYEGLDLETVAARYYEQIRADVERDPRKEYSNALFEAGYQTLLTTIRERPAAMRANLTAQ